MDFFPVKMQQNFKSSLLLLKVTSFRSSVLVDKIFHSLFGMLVQLKETLNCCTLYPNPLLPFTSGDSFSGFHHASAFTSLPDEGEKEKQITSFDGTIFVPDLS